MKYHQRILIILSLSIGLTIFVGCAKKKKYQPKYDRRQKVEKIIRYDTRDNMKLKKQSIIPIS